jgi:hypothetical protein
MRNKPPTEPPEKKTETLPEGAFEPLYDGSNLVVAVKVYDTGYPFPLPRTFDTLTIGVNPDCFIHVVEKGVSRIHCRLSRRGDKLHVRDAGSHNGTFFKAQRDSDFEVRPGDTFIAKPVRLLAMNAEMVAAYPTLVEILGGDDEQVLRPIGSNLSTPDAVVVAAVNEHHLMIVGESGCDHAVLARAIHQMSLLRDKPLVEIDHVPEDRAGQRKIIDDAAQSILVISIGPKTPLLDAAFVSMIFSSDHHIRVIALASSTQRANEVLRGGASVVNMDVIPLRPLARRRRIIPFVLDRMLVERGSDVRFERLTETNQRGLQAHDWPENLDELRIAAEYLSVIAREGSLRKAAVALGMSLTTFHTWVKGHGLTVRPESPLLRD